MARRTLLLVCLLAPLAAALTLVGVSSPTTGAVAFKNATLLTAAGPRIDKGVLVIKGGKIVAVGGPDTRIPKGATVIDASGQFIIPGLVDSHSHVGIYPRPAVPAHSDGNEGS